MRHGWEIAIGRFAQWIQWLSNSSDRDMTQMMNHHSLEAQRAGKGSKELDAASNDRITSSSECQKEQCSSAVIIFLKYTEHIEKLLLPVGTFTCPS